MTWEMKKRSKFFIYIFKFFRPPLVLQLHEAHARINDSEVCAEIFKNSMVEKYGPIALRDERVKGKLKILRKELCVSGINRASPQKVCFLIIFF